MVNSGENFSYNNAVGPTTKEAGFKIGTAYVGGKAVPSYGGGVCQVSSTLYYSALLANLKIVSRACHMYAQDYVQMCIRDRAGPAPAREAAPLPGDFRQQLSGLCHVGV